MSYNDFIRKPRGQVELSFYNNNSEKETSISTNFSLEGWRGKIKDQILSTGILPSKKYATLDGKSILNGSNYPYNESKQSIIPLWSRQLCNEQGYFTESPEYILSYESPREIDFFQIVGDQLRNEKPLEYEVEVIIENELGEREWEEQPQYCQIYFDNATRQYTSGQNIIKVYSVVVAPENNNFIQIVILDKKYKVLGAKLTIKRWSEGSTTSKIMGFSNSINMLFNSNQLISLKVVEDMRKDLNSPSYGVTSGYCVVKVSNADGRFTRNKDLLKKGRVIKPFISVGGGYDELGTYYSDEWSLSEKGDTLSCKAYDVLYSLHDLSIEKEMETLGSDFMNYYLLENISCFDAFLLLEEVINIAKRKASQYNSLIKFDLDEKLKELILDYYFINRTSAWEAVETLARCSLAYVYCDRSGLIKVVQDIFSVPTYTDAKINISRNNAFSIKLPTMEEGIANRISDSSYKRGDFISLTFELFPEDLISCTINGIEHTKVILDLTGYFMFTMEEAFVTTGQTLIDAKVFNHRIELIFDESIDQITEIDIQLYGELYSLSESSCSVTDEKSQIRYGEKNYNLSSGKFIFSRAKKVELLKRICEKYKDGIRKISCTWIGDGKLKLGDRVNCSDKLDNYDCINVSNEITLENDLRSENTLIIL